MHLYPGIVLHINHCRPTKVASMLFPTKLESLPPDQGIINAVPNRTRIIAARPRYRQCRPRKTILNIAARPRYHQCRFQQNSNHCRPWKVSSTISPPKIILNIAARPRYCQCRFQQNSNHCRPTKVCQWRQWSRERGVGVMTKSQQNEVRTVFCRDFDEYFEWALTNYIPAETAAEKSVAKIFGAVDRMLFCPNE